MAEAISRAERKRHTRSLLFGAARSTVAARGFSALAVRELTREAGIVPTAFYRHFETVDELALELIGQDVTAIRRLVDALAAEAEHPERWPGLLAAAGRAEPLTWATLAWAVPDTAHPVHGVLTAALQDARRRLSIALSRASAFAGLDADRLDAATDLLVVELVRAPVEAAAGGRGGSGCAGRLAVILGR